MLLEQVISLRPLTPLDQPFLAMLYATTRAPEIALVPWSAAQKAAFLQMQFTAQDRDYRQRYPQAGFTVILRAGEPVGRLYVDRRPGEIHLIDIALLPAQCNQGIGAYLLRGLLAEGTSRQTPVRLHVAVGNPAQRLYTRLGFVPCGAPDVYQAMVWQPIAQKLGQ